MPDPKSPRKLIHLIFPPAHTDSANGQDSLEVRFKTRPDTRPPVADGWAGAEMRVFTLFDSCSPTDRPTNRQTDKGSYRVACPQLKMAMVLILVIPDIIKRVKKKSWPSLCEAPNWSIWIICYPHCLNFIYLLLIYLLLLCFQWWFHPYNFQRLPKA